MLSSANKIQENRKWDCVIANQTVFLLGQIQPWKNQALVTLPGFPQFYLSCSHNPSPSINSQLKGGGSWMSLPQQPATPLEIRTLTETSYGSSRTLSVAAGAQWSLFDSVLLTVSYFSVDKTLYNSISSGSTIFTFLCVTWTSSNQIITEDGDRQLFSSAQYHDGTPTRSPTSKHTQWAPETKVNSPENSPWQSLLCRCFASPETTTLMVCVF